MSKVRLSKGVHRVLFIVLIGCLIGLYESGTDGETAADQISSERIYPIEINSEMIYRRSDDE